MFQKILIANRGEIACRVFLPRETRKCICRSLVMLRAKKNLKHGNIPL